MAVLDFVPPDTGNSIWKVNLPQRPRFLFLGRYCLYSLVVEAQSRSDEYACVISMEPRMGLHPVELAH